MTVDGQKEDEWSIVMTKMLPEYFEILYDFSVIQQAFQAVTTPEIPLEAQARKQWFLAKTQSTFDSKAKLAVRTGKQTRECLPLIFLYPIHLLLYTLISKCSYEAMSHFFGEPDQNENYGQKTGIHIQSYEWWQIHIINNSNIIVESLFSMLTACSDQGPWFTKSPTKQKILLCLHHNNLIDMLDAATTFGTLKLVAGAPRTNAIKKIIR